MNAQSPHKWWSTLESAVFDLSSSLLPFVGEGGGRCASRLVRLICCLIILTASSPGRLLNFSSLAMRLLGLPHLPPGRVRLGFSC